MKKKKTISIVLCLAFILVYLFSNVDMNVVNEAHASIEDKNSNSTISIYEKQLIDEMKKETNSLMNENKYLVEEISNLRKQLKNETKEVDAKFHGYTIYFSLNKRYSTLFRESEWKNGTTFTVDGTTYSKGIGFDRSENRDNNYYVAKLYNFNGESSRLTGYIGIDDLAKDLKDSEITFAVYNNDTITKCYNEFYGATLYETKFKRSDGLQKIDVNLKGANNVIVEFSVNQNSDLNYFLLLDPKLQ